MLLRGDRASKINNKVKTTITMKMKVNRLEKMSKKKI